MYNDIINNEQLPTISGLWGASTQEDMCWTHENMQW